MKIQLGEQSWPWDPDEIEVDEAIELKKASGGMNFAPFLAGVFELDPIAVRALVWFVRRREEPALLVEGVRFRMADLRILENVKEEADADPPRRAAQAAARNRAPRTSKTSKAS